MVIYIKVGDINGKKIESFNVNVKDRFEILNTIFMEQNCLFSPGMVMRKDTFSKYLYPRKIRRYKN